MKIPMESPRTEIGAITEGFCGRGETRGTADPVTRPNQRFPWHWKKELFRKSWQIGKEKQVDWYHNP